MRAQIEDLSKQVMNSLEKSFSKDKNLANLSEDKHEIMLYAARRAFDKEEMYKKLALALAKNLSADDVEYQLKSLRSPFGQKQHEAEQSHTMDDSGAAFATFMKTFVKDPDAKKRMKVFRQLEREMKYASSLTQLTMDSQLAAMVGVMHALGKFDSDRVKAAYARLATTRPMMEARMRKTLTLYLAFTYESFSLEELEQVREEFSLPSSKRLLAGVMQGHSDALISGSLDFGQLLIDGIRTAEATEEI